MPRLPFGRGTARAGAGEASVKPQTSNAQGHFMAPLAAYIGQG
jgi:hypothetical protein